MSSTHKLQWYRRIKDIFSHYKSIPSRLYSSVAEIRMIRQDIETIQGDLNLIKNSFYQWHQRPFELDIEKKSCE